MKYFEIYEFIYHLVAILLIVAKQIYNILGLFLPIFHIRNLNIFRERFNEEELEQMFTSLALAFAIDSTTLKDRCDRQRRYRDQTEVNLSKEIDKFKEKLSLMHPLCTDYEKAELLSTLFTQVRTFKIEIAKIYR